MATLPTDSFITRHLGHVTILSFPTASNPSSTASKVCLSCLVELRFGVVGLVKQSIRPSVSPSVHQSINQSSHSSHSSHSSQSIHPSIHPSINQSINQPRLEFTNSDQPDLCSISSFVWISLCLLFWLSKHPRRILFAPHTHWHT